MHVLNRRDDRLGLIRPVKPAILPMIPTQDASPVSMLDRRNGHRRTGVSGGKDSERSLSANRAVW
jgi:hypothetical protein